MTPATSWPGRQLLAGLVDGRPGGRRRRAGRRRCGTRCGRTGRPGWGTGRSGCRPRRCDSTPGTRKLSLNWPPALALQPDDGDRGDEPDAEHPERVAGAAAAKAVQKCTHGGPPGVAPARLRDERRIRQGPDAALTDWLAWTAAPHQRSVSAARDREPMTTPTSSTDRCEPDLSR